MSKLAGTIGLLLAATCGYAFGQSASFGLTLRVLPEQAVPEGPVELPVPPQALRLPPGRNAARLLYAGSAGDAKRFYESRLPGMGFYLAQQKDDRAVWERHDVRAELLFYPVVGMQETTGIIVTMRSRNAGNAASL
jgi:hypothetical protein